MNQETRSPETYEGENHSIMIRTERDLYSRYLQIRYIKLHFFLEIMDDGNMPRNKASALRGGMGQSLLMTNCIRDRNCEACDFEEDCLVRRLMYPEMKIRPPFMKTRDSEGFVIECENYDEWFSRGDILSFNLLLFGRTIAYFTQYLQAFYNLGMMGLGKDRVRFRVGRVTNTKGDILVEGNDVYKENYKVMLVEDYVRYRLSSHEFREVYEMPGICENRSMTDMNGVQFRLLFHSPLAIKYQGQIQNSFLPEAIMSALDRRLYILNCFEGNRENEDYERPAANEHVPSLINQKAYVEKVKRFSGTHNAKVAFTGIRGWCDLQDVDEAALTLLIAGELVHIGKNTSFGFGRYTLITHSGM